MKNLKLLILFILFVSPAMATKVTGGMNQNVLTRSCLKSESFTVKFEKGQKEALCKCVMSRYYPRVKKAPDLSDKAKLDQYQFVKKFFEAKKNTTVEDKYDAIGSIFDDMDHCIEELKLPFPTTKSEAEKDNKKEKATKKAVAKD